MIASLHIIGSRELGGAERWFLRFITALAAAGSPVQALVRGTSELALAQPKHLTLATLPMRTVWDPLSRWQVSRFALRSTAPIVQTYMGRATRLTHLPRGRGKVHVARLGGYYKLAPFRHAHVWIGNTRGLCDWMIQQGLSAQQVFHITNFAEPARPVPRSEIDRLRSRIAAREDDWLILHPARFVKVKGHDTLLEAFARLPAQIDGRRLRLILLGDGGLRDELLARARQLAIDERVVWAGWQRDPAPWFHLCDMVVFPSRDEETLGNVVLEAWAYARPLVATRFRGAREIVRPDEDAVLVPCGDASALAGAIAETIRSGERRATLVANGLQRIERDFSEPVIVGQYQALYAKLAANL
ncbi:MAG TPA: glycosyltransferase [Burkholderiales bacterium]|nr:glycosyltransferase [Burkholderiales bacterium]